MSSALIIIDMQNGFAHPEGSFGRTGKDLSLIQKTIPTIQHASNFFRSHGMPVIYTQQVHVPEFLDAKLHSVLGATVDRLASSGFLCLKGTWDAEILDELKPLKNDYVVEKNKASGFYDSWLELWLRYKKIKTLVITGCATGYCVIHTLLDAYARDYDIVVVSDGVGDAEPDVQTTLLKLFDDRFGRVLSWSEIEDYFRVSLESKRVLEVRPQSS